MEISYAHVSISSKHSGFAGELCNYEYNECESNPCLNDGKCTDRIGGFTCKCTRGYTGDRCHIKVSFYIYLLLFELFPLFSTIIVHINACFKHKLIAKSLQFECSLQLIKFELNVNVVQFKFQFKI